MTIVPRDIEFRRCQKCGQVEKEETSEIVVAGKHRDACDNITDNWVRFRAPPIGRSVVSRRPAARARVSFRPSFAT
jgi:hypothetical protein